MPHKALPAFIESLVCEITKMTLLPPDDVANIIQAYVFEGIDERSVKNALMKNKLKGPVSSELSEVFRLLKVKMVPGYLFVTDLELTYPKQTVHFMHAIDLASRFVYWNIFDKNVPFPVIHFIKELVREFPIGIRQIFFDKELFETKQTQPNRESLALKLKALCSKNGIALRPVDIAVQWKTQQLNLKVEDESQNLTPTLERMKDRIKHSILDYNFNKELRLNNGMSPFSKVIELIHQDSKKKERPLN